MPAHVLFIFPLNGKVTSASTSPLGDASKRVERESWDEARRRALRPECIYLLRCTVQPRRNPMERVRSRGVDAANTVLRAFGGTSTFQASMLAQVASGNDERLWWQPKPFVLLRGKPASLVAADS